MNSLEVKQFFTVRLTAPDKHFNWSISSNDQVIHHITNFISFAKHIGYPDISEISSDVKSGNEADFIDHDAFISSQCTQTKITTYLYEHCEQFKKEYEELYFSVIKTCKSRTEIYLEKCNDCMMLEKLELSSYK